MKPIVILGISILFLALSFGTVTGLYQLEFWGLNILGENTDINFIFMFLGVAGVVYYYIVHGEKKRSTQYV